MQGVTLWLLVGVLVWDYTCCSITCPDGYVCSDKETCCLTEHGYRCCPYPNAVCCSDRAHCCPAGFHCNLATKTCEKENQPWMKVTMVKKSPAEPSEPVAPLSSHISQELQRDPVSDQKKSLVFCDNYHACPDGTTCCRNLQGFWYCCPYSPGRCCVGSSRCCPLGYDCDITHTHCVKQNLRFPFTHKLNASSFPALLMSASEDKDRLKETPVTALTEASDGHHEAGVIRCDSKFYCSAGTTCCKNPAGRWSCCPYPLGTCCVDGVHCCEYGYTCDPSALTCRRWYSQVPSGPQQHAKTD